MWDAIIFISKKRPGLIRHVEWFTFEDGYSNAQEPKLITIPPFDDAADTDISTDIRNWPYLEPVSKLCPRGILVIRLRTEGRFIHIIEVQRRVKTRVDDEGKETQTEESFKGFVCSLNDQGESVNILLNFTQFFETRIEYRFQIFTAHSCDFLLPSYARLA